MTSRLTSKQITLLERQSRRGEPLAIPIEALFEEFYETRDRFLRDLLAVNQVGLVVSLTRRYRHRGVDDDDLEQVANIGLLKAIDRFEPQRGNTFATFATPTILGELRRYFRDSTWSVRVPRHLQEKAQLLAPATERLLAKLHRSPSLAELAAAVGLSIEELTEVLEVDANYKATSLDQPSYGDDTQYDIHGTPERGFEHVEDIEQLKQLTAGLSERQRDIVRMRFVDGLTQSRIAEHLGVSQMQVCRLLAQIVAQLRQQISQD